MQIHVQKQFRANRGSEVRLLPAPSPSPRIGLSESFPLSLSGCCARRLKVQCCHDRQFLFKFAKDRNRYREMDALGNPDRKTFQENYRRLIDETISQGQCRREPAWTESIAVGRKDFVGAIDEAKVYRRRFETEDLGSDAYALRESAWECDALKAKKAVRNSL